ncbi:MAG: CvpA family protein [Candidatus Dormibacteraeota bacterium]|nr:CvpA family protein [Candidatus Dormibacteraeota bacterium]
MRASVRLTAMLASLDSTPGQVFADLVLLVLVGINVYLGFRYGLMRRVVALLGVYVACFAATNLGNPIASLFQSRSVSSNAWAFILVFVIVCLMVEIMAALLHERLQRVLVVLFDRIGGSVLGAAVGLAEALVLFLVAFAVSQSPGTSLSPLSGPGETPAHAVGNSLVAGQVARLEPQMTRLLGPALPSNLSSHLQEGTATNTA